MGTTSSHAEKPVNHFDQALERAYRVKALAETAAELASTRRDGGGHRSSRDVLRQDERDANLWATVADMAEELVDHLSEVEKVIPRPMLASAA
ncbi:MAG: hypothetical protein KF785_09380 [Gemmatimonadales bacterium]|nr:hypothetical protein [Gemmatimonadales bacterium]